MFGRSDTKILLIVIIRLTSLFFMMDFFQFQAGKFTILKCEISF